MNYPQFINRQRLTMKVDWAEELGYDHDSRSAERTFLTIQKQSERLQHFLGTEAYNTLLWDVERE